MTWIELHDNLPDHPKTIACAAALKIDKDLLVGKLCRLWTWAINERENGFIADDEMDTVAEIMRWTKRPKMLFDGLCVVPQRGQYGFLERMEGGYVIHDWDERIGMLRLKREEHREKNRARVARYRQRKKDDQLEERNVLRTSDVTSTVTQCNAGTVPKPYPNQNDDDDGDHRAHARGIPDTRLESPEDVAHRRVLLEFLPCGLGEPTVPVDQEIGDMIMLPDFGATPELRADLIIRAMREVAKAPKGKRGWGTVVGLLKHWQKLGERSADNAKHGGNSGDDGSGGGGRFSAPTW